MGSGIGRDPSRSGFAGTLKPLSLAALCAHPARLAARRGRLPCDTGRVIKVDLHIHTADDPFDRIPHTASDVIDRAASLGFGALAITLHDRQFDSVSVAEYARARGITLIPGVERTIQGRHLLLINFPAHADRVASFDDVEALKMRHPTGLVIVPHAFYPLGNAMRGWLDGIAHLVDAVEYNGFYTTMVNFNRAAVTWAATHQKPVVGGSDTHRLVGFGRTCSLVDADANTADAICAAIRAGKVEVSTAPLSTVTLAIYVARMALGGRRSAAASPSLVTDPS